MEVRTMSQSVRSGVVANTPVSPLNKGMGSLDEALKPAEIAGLDWNLLKEDISLPCALLYREKLRHNLEWMRQFMSAYGVKLAPHGKTTVAPRLIQMQLDAGPWGITLATAHK